MSQEKKFHPRLRENGIIVGHVAQDIKQELVMLMLDFCPNVK